MKRFCQVMLVAVITMLTSLSLVSNSEAVNRTLRDSTVNLDTAVKVDDSTSTLTGLNSFVVDGVERAFQQWFWYRIGAAGGETSLDKLPKKVATSQPTPLSLLVTYTLAGKFDISILYELQSYPSGIKKAILKKTVTITNTSGAELDYHLFEYSDFDFSDTGVIGGDNDNLEGINNKMYQNGTQLDGSGVTLVHEASIPPSKWDLDSNQIYLKPEMKDASPTELFTPQTTYSYEDEMQFAYQWDFTIPAGEKVSFTISDNIYPTLPLTASKTHSGACIDYNGQTNYTIAFDNLNNVVDSLTNVRILDFLPKNTAVASPPSNGGIYDAATNTVSWNVASIAAASSQQTNSLSVLVSSAIDITNEVLLTSDQAFPTRITDFAALCNHPPSMNVIPDVTIQAGTAFNYQVVANDPDKTSLAYTLSGAPAGMTVSSTGLISWASSVAGTYIVTATATDAGTGKLSASRAFNLTVQKPNFAPSITSKPPITATDNQPYTYTLTATDPDGDTVSYALINAPLGMALTGNVITWMPTKAQVGSQAVQAMVSDGQGHYVYQDFTITVTHVNSPPDISLATAPPATATVGVFYSYPVTATDPDGDALSFSLIANPDPVPTGMTIGTTGVIGWTPTAAQNNKTHQVTAQVSDGFGGIATFSYSIVVGIPGTKVTPTITWATPAAITYGTALSATQLNATAGGVAGTFTYSPASGTVLNAGNNQTLTATFTPTDTTTYNTTTKTVTLNVNQAAATVTLSGLTATYNGSAKAVTAATTPAGLSVAITYAGSATAPTAAGSYAVVATVNNPNYIGGATGTLTIAKATPAITWPTPAPVFVGTALSAAQLNATSTVGGTFVYTPVSGTVMNTAGSQTLKADFTPTDAVNYSTASATVSLTVSTKTTPT
ncbi:MBG domain-containing protein, partial [Pelotalea chapellei]